MNALLSFYDRIAHRLYPVRALFWILGAVSLLAFAALVFLDRSPAGSTWLFLALVGLLWCLCALLVLHSFVHTPPRAGPDEPVGRRLYAWLARAGRGALALLMSVLNLGVLWMTIKSVGLLSRNL